MNDSLPGAREAQRQVFGEVSHRDMADYSAAAYNYLMKQQEQAYNLELWNLQNEYNSPAAQMKRYQDAGLNPNLIYSQQNTAAAPQAASATGFRSAGTAAKHFQNGMNMIGQIMQTVKSARETYDYMKYGRAEHSWRNSLLAYQGANASLENDWLQWFMGRDPEGNIVTPGTPRRRLFETQLDTKSAEYERVKALTSIIPDQQARTQALKALDDYRLQMLQGQNDAVLNIHTGNETVDSWLKVLIYLAMSKI